MKILQLDKNHALIGQQLTAAGFTVDEDHSSAYEAVLAKIEDYDGIIIRSRIPLDAAFLESAPHLKFIARVGAGMENIDVKKASELGISLINSPEGNRDSVAEHVVGMLLMLANRLSIAADEVKAGTWLREENRGDELCGKTFGIIGYGNMGKATARRISGFGMEVIYHDILPGLADDFAREVSLAELQATADVVSLHVPLTPETHYLVNAEFISAMKKDFYLVNTARGKNVQTAEVAKAIGSGKIKGAALDVLEYEKASFESLDTVPEDLRFLLESNKALITPHIAGWTHQSKVKLAQVIVDKILHQFGKQT